MKNSMAVGMKTVKRKFDFEETELRLGLPGGGGGSDGIVGKCINGINKEPKVDPAEKGINNNILMPKEKAFLPAVSNHDPENPPPKALVVGWPPVQSFRRNVLAIAVHKSSSSSHCEESSTTVTHEKLGINGGCSNSNNSGIGFVKVSMDGAPYLRKVDLRLYNSYRQLSDALGNMFSSFTVGNYGSQGMIDFMNKSKLMDLLNSSEYVPTYEDKDSDWMLVGDVPWEMFVNSCKRLRIMKGAEAIGLAPRAMEKYKKEAEESNPSQRERETSLLF